MTTSIVIAEWIAQGLPGVYVRELYLGEEGDKDLEHAFRIMRPLDVQVSGSRRTS